MNCEILRVEVTSNKAVGAPLGTSLTIVVSVGRGVIVTVPLSNELVTEIESELFVSVGSRLRSVTHNL